MLSSFPLLSSLIWLPVAGALVILCTGGDKQADVARLIAVIIATACLMLCIPLIEGFNVHTAQMQFVEDHSWIPLFGIRYHLGVDGISMPLIVLTAFTTLLVVLASYNSIKTQVAQYLAVFLIMQGIMIGVFCALDAMLFYVFWEAILVPMYLCIGIWGGKNRFYASIKFFIYTFLGSALMLVALIYLRARSGSFNIESFYPTVLTLAEQKWIFVAFLLAFAVKVPMWPFHTWLPDAHTEAPAGGSVILAAIMLKMGVYGFLRFNLPIVPDACQAFDWLMIGLSLIAICYIGFVAIVQTDMKKLIAYSSIAHMGFATLGAFLIYRIVAATGDMGDANLSMEGGMIQMLSHGFSSGALFFGVGVVYDRLHTRLIKDYGGVALKMPVFAALLMIFMMSNVGLPGTGGFVGEFMVIISSFRVGFGVAFIAATSLILGAAYTLWMYKRVFYGEITNPKVATLTEANAIEILVFILLGIAVIALGVYPQPVLTVFHASVDHLLELAIAHKTTAMSILV